MFGGIFSPPKTVEKLDLHKYEGVWYEISSSLFVKGVIERGCTCTTADYTLMPSGEVGVLNRCTRGGPEGTVTSIQGTATIPNPDEPGKLKVTFPQMGGVAGDYWVVGLGAPTFGSKGLYQYSVVSEPTRLALWVLARTLTMDAATYDGIIEDLKQNGFILPQMYLRPTQQEGCSYQ